MTSNNKKFVFSSFKLKSSSTSATNGIGNPIKYDASNIKKKHKSEEDYFNSDDGDDDNKVNSSKQDMDYIPAPGSPGCQLKQEEDEEDDEEDELDLYMKNIEKNAKKDLENVGKQIKDKKGTRDDIEKEDQEEEFYRWLEENPDKGVSLNEQEEGDGVDRDEEIDYDNDGNIILPEKSKYIDPLPSIDHSKIEYNVFEKNFYIEHEDIKNLNKEQVNELREKLDIKVSGINTPKPVCSFGHLSNNFDTKLIKQISKYEYERPTSIQSQAIPCILNGRDLIGIAKTGSGKTLSYIWPALIHILHQEELNSNDGPIVLILAPTRELVQQIYTEAKKYAKLYNINCVCAYGGDSLYEQTLKLKETCELLVCTPGRLIDLIKKKATNLLRVTYLVLDEADRMLDMGFEVQVRSIVNHTRPSRQLLLFSATFKKKIEKLARELLKEPIKIIQGELGEANENITQVIHIFNEPSDKWKWLLNNLIQFQSYGKLLIFVTQKQNSIELHQNLINLGYKCGLLHGDMHQSDRNEIIKKFKKDVKNTDGDDDESVLSILVATDVAARGIDINSIKTVVNYDVARDIDTHIHRIGRTARSNQTGYAYTLINPLKDKEFIPHLVKHLESNNQQVNKELLDVAHQVPWFKTSRNSLTTNTNKTIGGIGLGYKRSSQSLSNSSSTTTTESIVKQTSTTSNDRLNALKQAFKNSFKSNFHAASTDSTNTSSSVAIPSNCFKNTKQQKSTKTNDDQASKPKKSRWD